MDVRRGLVWAPLVVFAVVLAIVTTGLWRPADRTVRSAMIGKPLPEFSLDPLVPGKPGLSSAGFRRGQPRLLNIFASWCVPCAAEAPQLLRLEALGVPVDAVAIRDTTPAVAAFLRRHGNPYRAIGSDPGGAVQLALGSSGVPETFVIDGRGIIVAQHIGDIRAEDVDTLARAVGAAR